MTQQRWLYRALKVQASFGIRAGVMSCIASSLTVKGNFSIAWLERIGVLFFRLLIV